MTATDRSRFARGLAALSIAFDRYQLSEDRQALRAEVYFESLMGFEIEEVEVAVQRLIDHARNFPVPAEVREEIWRTRRAAQPAYAALPAYEPTEAEIAERKAQVAELFLRLDRLIAPRGATRRPTEAWEPTVEEVAEHERKRDLAREQLRMIHSVDGQAPA